VKSASLRSHDVVPSMTAIAAPSTPRNVTAVAGDGRVTIRFGLPSANGGSPIVSYPIRGGGKAIRVTGRTILVLTGGSRSHYGVIEGLTNDRSCTFTFTADNIAGSSAPASVGPVTPSP
jgi:hypothetical protein